MKKGFTLIELLAVIVILAILALIVSPIISGVISDAKKAAAERSMEGYIKAVELAEVKEQGKNGGKVVKKLSKLSVEVSNDKVTSQTVKINSTGTVNTASAKVDGYYCRYVKGENTDCQSNRFEPAIEINYDYAWIYCQNCEKERALQIIIHTDSDKTYYYDGYPMYDITDSSYLKGQNSILSTDGYKYIGEQYNKVYAIVVPQKSFSKDLITEANYTPEVLTYDCKISESPARVVQVQVVYDIGNTGIPYACDYKTADFQQKYLKSDLNRDGKVDYNDLRPIAVGYAYFPEESFPEE